MTWTGRDGRPPAHARARNVSSVSPSTRPRKRRNRQRLQHRKASVAGPDLEHGDRVVPTKEWICRLTSHLHAKHERQFEISAVCTKSTPPQSQSVRAGLLRWVLEEGERARKWGQQLMVHGAARRTVYLKCSRCCSSTLLSSAPPETHRPRTLVPQLRRTARRMSSERNPRAGAPSAPFP